MPLMDVNSAMGCCRCLSRVFDCRCWHEGMISSSVNLICWWSAQLCHGFVDSSHKGFVAWWMDDRLIWSSLIPSNLMTDAIWVPNIIAVIIVVIFAVKYWLRKVHLRRHHSWSSQILFCALLQKKTKWVQTRSNGLARNQDPRLPKRVILECCFSDKLYSSVSCFCVMAHRI